MLANIETNNSVALLSHWLSKQISSESLAWLENQREQIVLNAAERKLFTAFSSVSRYIEKNNLKLSISDLETANNLKLGWNLSGWTLEQVGRTILILSFPHRNPDEYVKTLEKIFAAADVGEAIALYQSLPLLPYPERFKLRAAEGIRTNMTSVFNAIALYNPYPAEYLDDLAWNQMILKALFVGTPLHPIWGLKRRNNQQLSQMLLDYARERLAAKRTVNPELWELVAPFTSSEEVANLKAAFNKIYG